MRLLLNGVPRQPPGRKPFDWIGGQSVWKEAADRQRKTGGSSITGGQDTDCACPGSSELRATPNDLGILGAEVDEPFFGMMGW